MANDSKAEGTDENTDKPTTSLTNSSVQVSTSFDSRPSKVVDEDKSAETVQSTMDVVANNSTEKSPAPAGLFLLLFCLLQS